MNEKQFDPELAKTLFPEPKPSYRPWAQKRNFAKARFYKMKTLIEQTDKENVFTIPESIAANVLLHIIELVLRKWDSESEASKQKFGKR